jgi:hypothetical protein
VDFTNYHENDNGTCDRTILTWVFFALLITMILMALQIAFRIFALTWRAWKSKYLKFDTFGLARVLLTCTSGTMVLVFTTRALAVVLKGDNYEKARLSALAAQAVFSLFLVTSLCFVGISMLFVIRMSVHLQTGVERYKRNLLTGAIANGVVVTIIVVVLTFMRNLFAFAIFIAAHSLTAWATYYILQRRLKHSFPTTSVVSNHVIQAITIAANRMVIGSVLLIFGALFFVVSYSVGQRLRSVALLGPVTMTSVIANYATIMFLVDASVRCIEKLEKNRLSHIGAPDVFVEIPSQIANGIIEQVTVSGAIVTVDKSSEKTRNDRSTSYANVVYPSFQSSQSFAAEEPESEVGGNEKKISSIPSQP